MVKFLNIVQNEPLFDYKALFNYSEIFNYGAFIIAFFNMLH